MPSPVTTYRALHRVEDHGTKGEGGSACRERQHELKLPTRARPGRQAVTPSGYIRLFAAVLASTSLLGPGLHPVDVRMLGEVLVAAEGAELVVAGEHAEDEELGVVRDAFGGAHGLKAVDTEHVLAR